MDKNSKQPPRSFLVPRNPSIDRRYRPHPDPEVKKIDFDNLSEEGTDNDDSGESYDFENDKVRSLNSVDATELSSNDLLISNSANSESTECSSSNSTHLESAEVYLRLRPIKNSEISCPNYKIKGNTLITVPMNEANSSKNCLEKHFVFTDIFDDNYYQSDIYSNCVEQRIVSEQNFTIMTYGTSGSGKTFTLLGGVDTPGIIPRSIQHIFALYSKNIAKTPTLAIKCGEIIFLNDNQINECLLKRKILLGNNFNDVKHQHDRVRCKINIDHKFAEIPNEDSNFNVSIWVSFVEIYNENIYDLLHIASENSHKRDSLKVYTNNSNVYIKNLTSVFVKDSLEAYKLLTLGLKQVNYAATAVNQNSSRSHCIFIIDCLKSYRNCDVIRSTYKYCDLAGSERLGKTQNLGNRLKEAQRINTSLMVLGRCLDIAYQNQSKRNQEIIPFRDSKLTMILKAPLLGKEKIALLVNISPTEEYYEENLNVLSFSSIAKNIKIVAKKPEKVKQRFSVLSNFVNPHVNDDRCAELLEENISLKNENEWLRNELREVENSRAKVISEMKADYIANTKHLKRVAAKHAESLTTYYEAKLQIKAEQYERLTKQFDKIIKLNKTIEILDDDEDAEVDEEDEEDEGNEDNEDITVSDPSLDSYKSCDAKDSAKRNLNAKNGTINTLSVSTGNSSENTDLSCSQYQSHEANPLHSVEIIDQEENNNPITEKTILSNNIENLNDRKPTDKKRLSLNNENLEKPAIDLKKRRLTASPTF